MMAAVASESEVKVTFAVTLTLAATAVIIASRAAGNSWRILTRNAEASKFATSPDTVKTVVITGE